MLVFIYLAMVEKNRRSYEPFYFFLMQKFSNVYLIAPINFSEILASNDTSGCPTRLPKYDNVASMNERMATKATRLTTTLATNFTAPIAPTETASMMFRSFL